MYGKLEMFESLAWYFKETFADEIGSLLLLLPLFPPDNIVAAGVWSGMLLVIYIIIIVIQKKQKNKPS